MGCGAVCCTFVDVVVSAFTGVSRVLSGVKGSLTGWYMAPQSF